MIDQIKAPAESKQLNAITYFEAFHKAAWEHLDGYENGYREWFDITMDACDFSPEEYFIQQYYFNDCQQRGITPKHLAHKYSHELYQKVLESMYSSCLNPKLGAALAANL